MDLLLYLCFEKDYVRKTRNVIIDIQYTNRSREESNPEFRVIRSIDAVGIQNAPSDFLELNRRI